MSLPFALTRRGLGVLAAAAVFALTSALIAVPAHADANVQITGPAGPVTVGTPYAYIVTVPGAPAQAAGNNGQLDFGVDLTDPGGTFTAFTSNDPDRVNCQVIDAAMYCSDNSPGVTDLTVTLTAQPATVGVTTARVFLTNLGYAETTTTINPPAPRMTGVSPSSGSTAGGDSVTVTGTDLAGATAITFGAGHHATAVSCSATTCTATSPAAPAGVVDVQVTTPGGTSTPSAADRYTYVAPLADLSVTLTATARPGLLNARIDYVLKVTNHGPAALTSATVKATLPTAGSATSSDCTPVGGKVTCTLTTLASGASATRHFTVPLGLLTLGLPYAVTATRTASTPTDPATGNDSATRSCTAITSLIIHCS
ncbi:MAG: IPT/TIG domain-containing protein [Streptosporangiaceae bacterium]